MTPSFTLGPSWVDQYVSSIVLLNALLGHPATAPASRPATPESIILTLQKIARGQYKTDQASVSGGLVTREWNFQAPALTPSKNYLVIVLNCSTATSDFVSVESGGIVFEDPAWAVLAAHAISQIPRLGAPLASGDADLWRRLESVQGAIRSNKYSAHDFLAPISGFLPPSSQPEFRLMEVTSEQLRALRARGLQSFGKPLRFYELFQRPAAVR